MNIKEMKIEEIKPYENNPRKNDKAVDGVANSIKEFGFKVPIVIDKNNVIVCGHTRYKAALQLGLNKVPCIIADDLTDEQIKAYRLADNKVGELAEWDTDVLADELQELSLEDFDMSEFGFKEMCYDESDYENISADDTEKTTRFDHTLKLDKITMILTDDEYQTLIEKYNDYVEENGVNYGFVRSLLNGY